MFIPPRLACLAPVFASILLCSAISDVYSSSTDTPGLLQKPDFINPNSRFIQADTLPAPQAIDSLLQLDEILIQSTRIREPLRYQPVDVQYIDSLRLAHYRSMPVSAVLSRYSNLFIRDNGPGGLATLSQRGLASSQTQVLWEGFPLNSLSLGLADLSVIPSGLFSSVEVSPGTPSSAFGGRAARRSSRPSP
jgi:outer membrane cobalamin receptor